MRLLLDTHALYWYIEGDAKLSATAESIIQSTANEILISPASYWEIAIKVSLGKWALNRPYEEFIDLALKHYGFRVLPVLPVHTAKLIGMPYPPNHRDPFDRLLAAQTIAEGIPLVSADPKLDAYAIRRIW